MPGAARKPVGLFRCAPALPGPTVTASPGGAVETVPQADPPLQREPVTVRVMRPQDDLAALNVGNPFDWLAETWEVMAAEAPDFPYVRLTGLLGERPVGFALGTPAPVSVGGFGAVMLHVRQPYRRRGVGTALRAAFREAVRGRCPGLTHSYAEGDADGAAAAAAWGLEETARHHESVLDLTRLDPARFDVVEPPGVQLVPLPDDADEAGWRELHAYVQERYYEAPDSADGGGDLPYGVFRGGVSEPWMALTAQRDGQPVGVTCVMRRGSGSTVNTMFTGVSPTARGEGLAVLLKARHAQLLAARGFTRIHTQNMAGNAPILAANARLGFVRDSGYVDVVERL
jgi:GNAT superfamily N-acetyltransferase